MPGEAAAAAQLRPLTESDAALISSHRECMFAETGRYERGRLQAMSAAFLPWLQPRLADGRYFGWGIDVAARTVASLGMMWLDWPPHPLHLRPGRGYLLNLYVEPEARRRGLARQLAVQALQTAQGAGIDAVVLHPTEQAVALYQKLGFTASNEMRWLQPGAS